MKKLIMLLFVGIISIGYADDDVIDNTNNLETQSVEVTEAYKENMADGDKFIENKSYSKALGYYMNAFKEKKDDIPALLGIANSYEKMYQTDKALGVYRKILKISPKNKFAQGKKLILEEKMLSGMSYSKKEEYFQEFETYIKREGYSNSETIYTLGKIYMNDKSFERAYNIFRKDENRDYRNSFGAATTARFLGKYEIAIKYYKSTLDEKPDFYPVYIGLGSAYQLEKSYDEAIENYNKYLKYVNDPNVYVSISNIYMAKNDYESAKNILEEGLRKNANNGKIREKLAEVYRILKLK